MEKPLIWIIDEEWPDYELEKQLLKTQYPDCDIRFSTSTMPQIWTHSGKTPMPSSVRYMLPCRQPPFSA